MRRIWIDFNDIHGCETTSLTKFADGIILPGDHVTCYDNDGMECRGSVESLRADGLVRLHIDHDTILHLPVEREY